MQVGGTVVRFGVITKESTDAEVLAALPTPKTLRPGITNAAAQDAYNAVDQLAQRPKLAESPPEVFQQLGDLVQNLDHSKFPVKDRFFKLRKRLKPDGWLASQLPQPKLMQPDALHLRKAAAWTIGVLNTHLRTSYEEARLTLLRSQRQVPKPLKEAISQALSRNWIFEKLGLDKQ